MKGKILSLLLAIAIMLPLMAGLAGCSSGDGSATAKVNPASAKTIGNAKKNGVEIVIPEGTFEKTVEVSINGADENAAPSGTGASFLSTPVQLSSDGGEHTLGETVTVRFKLPDSIGQEDYLTLMGAYYDGESWTYIFPDFEALEKGYLEFGTPHFSIFAPVKLDKDKALEKYAHTLAVQNVTGNPQNWGDAGLMEELNGYFSDTLEAMGFTDKTAQGVIMQKLAEENIIGAMASDIKNGNIADISGHAAEHIAKAIMKSSDVKKFKDSLPNAAGGAVSGAVAAAIELYETGDYGKAYKEFVYSASGFVPGVKIAKAVVEASKAGISMWQNYSIEHAYQAVYLKQSVASDGSTTDEVWTMVFYNMGSGLDFLKREYRTAYAAANGKTLKELDKDKELRERLNNAVENDVKRNFINRYTRTNAIEAEQASIQEQLALFGKYGLLDPDTYLGFPDHMSLTTRIDSLMKIRQSIIDIAGGDRSVFGSSDEKIEDNLAFLVRDWLRSGKDRAKFYKLMQELGFLKKPGEGQDSALAWMLSEVDMLSVESGDGFTHTLARGRGTYKVYSKESGDVFEASMTWTEPNSSYRAEEAVRINISANIDTYEWHGSQDDIYLHQGLNYVGASIGARFDVPGISHGGVTGSSVDLKDEDGKSHTQVGTKYGLIETGSISRDVSAVFPKGSEHHDRISLYVSTTSGTVRYNYVYE
jgi:hypothetical protein